MRILFILLVPPVFLVGVMALGFGVGPWAAYAAIALGVGAVLWRVLRWPA